jgi:hypothetical protein
MFSNRTMVSPAACSSRTMDSHVVCSNIESHVLRRRLHFCARAHKYWILSSCKRTQPRTQHGMLFFCKSTNRRLLCSITARRG